MIYIDTDDFKKLHNTCVTIGKFDGLHMGHQLLFEELARQHANGYTSVVFTFDRQPASELRKEKTDLIYSSEIKKKMLEKHGPDVLISYPFSKKVADLSPIEFVKSILIDKLDMKLIVVGTDFRFGKNREGDIAFLKSVEKKFGFRTVVFEKECFEGREISSTFIRELISEGKQEEAEKMLRKEYFD